MQSSAHNAPVHVAKGSALVMKLQFDAGIDRMQFGRKISPRDRRLTVGFGDTQRQRWWAKSFKRGLQQLRHLLRWPG